jgi:hypothetical protein
MENKILLLTGAPHTGKTILERINASIWSLPEAIAVIGSAKLNPAQLATHLSQTTYPMSTLNITFTKTEILLLIIICPS